MSNALSLIETTLSPLELASAINLLEELTVISHCGKVLKVMSWGNTTNGEVKIPENGIALSDVIIEFIAQGMKQFDEPSTKAGLNSNISITQNAILVNGTGILELRLGNNEYFDNLAISGYGLSNQIEEAEHIRRIIKAMTLIKQITTQGSFFSGGDLKVTVKLCKFYSDVDLSSREAILALIKNNIYKGEFNNSSYINMLPLGLVLKNGNFYFDEYEITADKAKEFFNY